MTKRSPKDIDNSPRMNKKRRKEQIKNNLIDEELSTNESAKLVSSGNEMISNSEYDLHKHSEHVNEDGNLLHNVEDEHTKRVGRPRGRRSSLIGSMSKRHDIHPVLEPLSLDSLRNDNQLCKEALCLYSQRLPPGLELYDICRTPRFIKTEAEGILQQKMRLSETGLTEDLSCPICMGTYQNVAVVKDCLHRFCEECIERWLRTGHQDCPKCRIRIPSRRSLREDPIFQRIVRRLFPDVEGFERQNDKAVASVNQRKTGLSDCIFYQSYSTSVGQHKLSRREQQQQQRGYDRLSSNRQSDPVKNESDIQQKESPQSEEDMDFPTVELNLIPMNDDDSLHTLLNKKLTPSHRLSIKQLSRMISDSAGIDLNTRLKLSIGKNKPPLDEKMILSDIIQSKKESKIILFEEYAN